jgi:hypothetical protein
MTALARIHLRYRSGSVARCAGFCGGCAAAFVAEVAALYQDGEAA